MTEAGVNHIDRSAWRAELPGGLSRQRRVELEGTSAVVLGPGLLAFLDT